MGTEFHVSHGVGLFLKKFHVLLQKVVTQTLATRKDRQEDGRTLIANTAMNRRLREIPYKTILLVVPAFPHSSLSG